ncbi:MAG: hypothetical protein GY757_36780 [bacterium]|nr:hypothetical protein [bacterium]
MMRVKNKKLPVRLIFLGIAALLLMGTFAYPRDSAPKEMHGKVTAVVGERIHISLSLQEFLPSPGAEVKLGEEMAGMFVTLKGKFVIIQVNVDSCIAKAVGKGEHGKPAAGMAAVVKTPYPYHWQRRSSYISIDGPKGKELLQMAEGSGEIGKMGQNAVARAYTDRGDHDRALVWWERAAKDTNGKMYIQQSAMGRATILTIRGEYQKAQEILKKAASQLEPGSDKMDFNTYSASPDGRAYVKLLKELGGIYRYELKNIEESKRWYRAAAKVLADCATRRTPKPGHAKYYFYQSILRDLVAIHRDELKDDAAAVPWLKALAKTGNKRAQKTLTEMGRQ